VLAVTSLTAAAAADEGGSVTDQGDTRTQEELDAWQATYEAMIA
jgi:hypothetical protein